MVHIHTIYTGFTHFCREISLVVITRFGRHFLAKIWWGEALKHFRVPGVRQLPALAHPATPEGEKVCHGNAFYGEMTRL